MRLFWKLYIALTGWKTIGRYPSEIKKGVLIIAPHTSGWDFLTAVAFRSKERLKAKYLAKKELFRFPFGIVFKWLGGYPVDRGKARNLVDATVNIFNSSSNLEDVAGKKPHALDTAIWIMYYMAYNDGYFFSGFNFINCKIYDELR